MIIKNYKAFSLASSAYSLIFLIIVNYMHTAHPWILYCIPVFIIWPLAVCLPRLFGNKTFAFGLSGTVAVYYAVLNMTIAQGHPWAVYAAFAVLWYPFSLILGKKPFLYSLFGLVWCVLFFGAVNMITSPENIWAVYPIFAAIWWPLSISCFKKVRMT